jgi:hypothetical protein
MVNELRIRNLTKDVVGLTNKIINAKDEDASWLHSPDQEMPDPAL